MSTSIHKRTAEIEAFRLQESSRNTAQAGAFISHHARSEKSSFHDRCQHIHGEDWEKEWKARKPA